MPLTIMETKNMLSQKKSDIVFLLEWKVSAMLVFMLMGPSKLHLSSFDSLHEQMFLISISPILVISVPSLFPTEVSVWTLCPKSSDFMLSQKV